MNYHRKITSLALSVCILAAVIRNSFPCAIIAVAAFALYGFWCRYEPRKIDVTEATLKDVNSKLNALMLKAGMVRK